MTTVPHGGPRSSAYGQSYPDPIAPNRRFREHGRLSEPLGWLSESSSRLQSVLPPNTEPYAANGLPPNSITEASPSPHFTFRTTSTSASSRQHRHDGQSQRPDLDSKTVNRNVKFAEPQAKTDLQESDAAAEPSSQYLFSPPRENLAGIHLPVRPIQNRTQHDATIANTRASTEPIKSNFFSDPASIASSGTRQLETGLRPAVRQKIWFNSSAQGNRSVRTFVTRRGLPKSRFSPTSDSRDRNQPAMPNTSLFPRKCKSLGVLGYVASAHPNRELDPKFYTDVASLRLR